MTTINREVLDVEQIRSTISMQIAQGNKLAAEQEKFNAETRKLNREARFYPFLALGAFFGAAVAFGKLLFGG